MSEYFRGKRVIRNLPMGSLYSARLMEHVHFRSIVLDGEDKEFRWSSELHEPITTETPVAYRDFTRPQLTEDIADA